MVNDFVSSAVSAGHQKPDGNTTDSAPPAAMVEKVAGSENTENVCASLNVSSEVNTCTGVHTVDIPFPGARKKTIAQLEAARARQTWSYSQKSAEAV